MINTKLCVLYQFELKILVNLNNACIVVGKLFKVLDDESDQSINYCYRSSQFILPQQSVWRVVNGTKSNGLNHIFTNKGNSRRGLGHLFIISSSFYFFYKIDFEQYFFNADQKNDNNTFHKKFLYNFFISFDSNPTQTQNLTLN